MVSITPFFFFIFLMILTAECHIIIQVNELKPNNEEINIKYDRKRFIKGGFFYYVLLSYQRRWIVVFAVQWCLSVYRPPRNTICVSCYEGAKNMVSFLNKLQNDENIDRQGDPPLEPSSPKGISHAWEWMNEMMKKEEEMNEKAVFLESLLGALREGLHTDILLKPGGGGTPIPAHRALLATRSGILRTILESDECKAATEEESLSLPELSHEELLALLEFLYSGKLNREKAKAHAYSLLVAADKYDIHYLKKFCEIQILGFLDSSNALKVLEVSDACSNKKLKESALNSIIKHMNDVVFSDKFYEFSMKNAHLCVDITRALLMEVKEIKGLPSSRTIENG